MYFILQGPQGVGNLTACYLQEYSAGSSSAASYTETDPVPYDDNFKVEFIRSVKYNMLFKCFYVLIFK